ncbi:MAG: FG-GAP repeat protein [Proteobacteria bacterium]|nr:FG-GAP repeat protein [Pseudomonadota bacterium]
MKKATFTFCLAALLLNSAAAFAQTADNTQWVLEPGRMIGGSSSFSGARLMDPVMLDFDGDGIEDLIFGAPGTSPSGVSSAGSIFVICGKKDRDLTGKIDSTSWDDFDYRFDGHYQNGMLGMNLMVGDFNGDGLKDLAASEPGATGTVYIFYGGKQRDKGIYDIQHQNAFDVSFTTTEHGSLLGLSGCIGDFNRDGIDDLAMAYITHNTSLAANTSQVAILAMRREWEKKSYDIGSKIYGKTVLSRPVSSNTRVLHTCAVGDFNDDNLPDIALGMPLDTHQKDKAAGSVTVIYQPHKYNGTLIDLTKVDEKVGIRISGNQAGAMFGYALAAGDFTGDGRDDLAISAPSRLIKGPESEGAVYIYDANHWPTESGEQPETLQISGKGGQFGYRLYSTDVNNDNRIDLVISAPTYGKLKEGAVSAYFGGPFFVESLGDDKRATVELLGSDFMGFGLGTAFGDFNGDGKKDAAIRTVADPMQRANTGALAILSNFAELPQSSTISDNFLTVLAPNQGGGISTKVQLVQYQDKTWYAWLSPKGMGTRSLICLVEKRESFDSDISMATAGSCDIQIVGPENYEIADFTINMSPTLKPQLTIGIPNMPVKKATGVVAVIPLPDSITQPLVLNLNSNTLKSESQAFILSDESAGALGTKLEWRDLDQDGFEDLIIGAPKRKIDAELSGSIFVVKGNAERANNFYELTGKNVIQYEGFADEEFGGQWQILDFNGDGKLDILAAAAHTPDAAGDEYATVYSIYEAGYKPPKSYNVRSPEMSAMRISTPQVRAGLDIVPQTIDINEDGLEDLILIAPEYRAGLQKQGAAFVIPSSTHNKSGDLRLSDETHYVFSFTPGRNERLLDLRFRHVNGKLLVVTSVADLATGLTTSLNAFEEPDNEKYQGDYTESKLKRVLSEARLPALARLSMIIDPEKKHDELWIVFPFAGVTQSGQGVAQKVKD